MSFHKILERLREASKGQRGMKDSCSVSKYDLSELLCDFDRLDYQARLLVPKLESIEKERDESQSKLDTLSTRFTALIQQNNTLAAENERLSEELSKAESERDYQKLLAIDCAEQCIKSGNEIVELSEKLAAMESQEPVPVAWRRYCGIVAGSPCFAYREKEPPADDGFTWKKLCYAKLVPADKPARITEQDAREICNSYWEFCTGHVVAKDAAVRIGQWMAHGGSELLAKLNADRCPSHESEQGYNPKTFGAIPGQQTEGE